MASPRLKEKSKEKPKKKSSVKEKRNGSLSKFQKFETVRMHRSELKEAPFNPRRISDKARDKLKKNIKDRGFMGGIIWNKRSGNLVSGHQRLSVLDTLEKTKDYYLDVQVVDLDDKTEKEQIIFFNNQSSQGDWDAEKLESLFTTGGIDYEGTGFDLGEIHQMFGGNLDLGQSIIEKKVKEKLDELKKSLEAVVANNDKAGVVIGGGPGKKKKVDVDDPNFYLTFVFPDFDTRLKLTEMMQWTNSEWQDGKELLKLLGKGEEDV